MPRRLPWSPRRRTSSSADDRGVAERGPPVITVSVVVTLDIPSALSLKDKRAVVRSLVERLRQRQQVAAAEVGLQDVVRAGQIGYAVVSGDRATARHRAEETLRAIEAEILGRAEVVDVARDEGEIDA